MPEEAPSRPERILSIDVLRGLTIFLMILVNDIGHEDAIPFWLKHFAPHDADGMTFVDVIFPAFLLIVGMAIPFSLGRRLERGRSIVPVLAHVFLRTLGLLAIGVLMVNSYTLGPSSWILPPPLWTLLMFLGVIAVWNRLPADPTARRRGLIVRTAGAALLIFLVLIYNHADVPDEAFLEIRTMWWGILGLIAWAYLAGALIYLAFRDRVELLTLAAVLLFCLQPADKMGLFSGWQPLGLFGEGVLAGFTPRNYLDFGAQLGAHGALVVLGTLMGAMLKPASPVQSHEGRIAWALAFAGMLWLSGSLLYTMHPLHEMWRINKNAATIPWCLVSAAYTVLVWVVIYWLLDVLGLKAGWSGFFARAGENPLFAYVLAYAIYAAVDSLRLLAPGLGLWNWAAGSMVLTLGRGIVYAVFVTWFVGWLKDRGVAMKL